MKLWTLGYTIYFLKGSFVSEKVYQPFLSQLSKSLNQTIEITSSDLFQRNEYPPNSILMGHSFGGYLALLDYLKNQQNIQGIVLFNSHCNTNRKAIYPSIYQSDIKIPMLTILGTYDSKLPIAISIDDYEDSRLQNLKDKYYMIEPKMDHLSVWKDKKIRDKYVNVTESFIQNILTSNISDKKEIREIREICRNNNQILDYEWNEFFKDGISFHQSFHLMDSIFGLMIGKSNWNLIHFLFFLFFKPIQENGFYQSYSSIWIKRMNHQNETELIEKYQTIHPLLSAYDYNIKSLGNIYPYSISKWILCKPTIKMNSYEIYKVEFPYNITYYHFPHPIRVILNYLQR